MERRLLVQVHACVYRETVTHCGGNGVDQSSAPVANQEAARTTLAVINRHFDPSLPPAAVAFGRCR